MHAPADSPTGFAVPTSALKSPTDTPGLSRTTGTGSPATDSTLDFEAVNGNQLTAASTLYTWKGCLYVPSGGDSYTFRFQNTPSSTVTFGLSTDLGSVAAAHDYDWNEAAERFRDALKATPVWADTRWA